MYCETCGVEMVERLATRKAPYAYRLSGLDNLCLIGITVRTCPNCGVESPVIPKLGELHKEIANFLVHKPALLNGREVRFLRKHAGLPSNKFATLIGIGPERLSRVENNPGESLSESADRLIRVLSYGCTKNETFKDLLFGVAEAIENHKKLTPKPTFTIDKDGWQQAA